MRLEAVLQDEFSEIAIAISCLMIVFAESATRQILGTAMQQQVDNITEILKNLPDNFGYAIAWDQVIKCPVDV